MPNSEFLTGNRGEWSEIYAFFRLLSEGKVYAANGDLERIPDTYLPIIKIIREETAGEVREYFTGDEIRVDVNGQETLTVPASEVAYNADLLIMQLKDPKISKQKGSFELRETEIFMNKLLVYKIKAPASGIRQKFGGKADITMEVKDPTSGIHSEAAFSMKSYLGGNSSLGNASEATNFIFEVHGINDEQMEKCNSINTPHKVIDRMNYLKDNGCSLSYVRPNREQASVNLLMISEGMEKIVAWALYYYYWHQISSFEEIIDNLVNDNPLNYPNARALYTKRMKDFLYACFSGLNLGMPWDGSRDVSGGYIVVKKNGEVLAYHNYIQDAFMQFLLKGCMLDKGSTTKHKFGVVYKEGEKYFIKLNLQIRFK